MKKSEIYTIPNLLSFYRLLAFPFILYLVLSGNEKWFAILLAINLVTDALDGFIARTFNMETQLGAKLDSLADNFTYILAFLGVYVFKLHDFMPHIYSFVFWFFILFSAIMIPVIRYGKTPSFHLYSWKIGGYIQGAFFIVLFTWGFFTHFYYFMVIWGILAALEHISIQFIIPGMRSNVKGLYWVLRER